MLQSNPPPPAPIPSPAWEGPSSSTHIWALYNTYRKSPKISDTRKFAVITLKVKQDGFSLK